MPGSPMSQEYTTSLRVCNSHALPITLHLEPWGEQYTMPPEATFLVVVRGPEGDALEVECAEDHIVLYGWPGSVVTLFYAGKEVGAGAAERAPVPLTPQLQHGISQAGA
jgi:hypothetical protein